MEVVVECVREQHNFAARAFQPPKPEPRSSEPRAPRPPSSAEPTYRAGDRVRHPTFGVGIVVGVRADATTEIIDVSFAGAVGVKKLDTAFAPLTRA